jgi:hypothetical protein
VQLLNVYICRKNRRESVYLIYPDSILSSRVSHFNRTKYILLLVLVMLMLAYMAAYVYGLLFYKHPVEPFFGVSRRTQPVFFLAYSPPKFYLLSKLH